MADKGSLFAGSDDRYPVLAHRSPDTAVADFQTNLFQIFGHPWPTITVQAQAVLFPDMGQQNHVFTLTLADRAGTIGAIPPRADIHNLAQPFGRKSSTIFLDESKPHGFCPAKNMVALSATNGPLDRLLYASTLTLPSPHEAAGFLYAAWLLLVPDQIGQTAQAKSSDPAEPTGSVSKTQRQNRTQPVFA
jgi:hypothetical protein